MDYTVVIRKAPDGVFIGSCPVVPEAHTQGQTYDECLANMKEAIEVSLEFRKECGEEIPQEAGTSRVTVAI